MTLERSAGVILFRDDAAGRRFLLLDYGHHWDYPKGHVEAGEDDPTAAKRELAEETGITEVELLEGFAREMAYVFRGRRGNLIKKTVIFFIGRANEETVKLSHEHVGYAWLPADEALAKLTYANARAMLDAALKWMDEKEI